jgi:hypothetical protein
MLKFKLGCYNKYRPRTPLLPPTLAATPRRSAPPRLAPPHHTPALPRPQCPAEPHQRSALSPGFTLSPLAPVRAAPSPEFDQVSPQVSSTAATISRRRWLSGLPDHLCTSAACLRISSTGSRSRGTSAATPPQIPRTPPASTAGLRRRAPCTTPCSSPSPGEPPHPLRPPFCAGLGRP